MTTVLMTKAGLASIYVDESQVTAHEARGWQRAKIAYGEQEMAVPYGGSVDFEAGSELKLGGIAVEASAEEINTLVGGAPAPEVGTLETMHERHYQITPAAVSATAIHAAIPLTGAVQTITAAITNPDVPRTVTVKGNAAGMTGNVVITGTNIDDEVITDTIALSGTGEVESVKAFKTVTSIQLPAQTHDPDAAQQETGTVVGTITQNGNAEIIVTAIGMGNTPKTVSVAVSQGIKQQETATVAGAVTTTGNAKLTVAAAGMGNTPKDVAVAVIAGTQQVETATAVGTITASGNGKATVITAGMPNTPKQVVFAVSQGVKQQETGTVIGAITTSGNAKVTVAAAGMGNTPKDVAVAVVQGTLQVETATVIGDIVNAGLAKVTVAAAGLSAPVDCYVYVDALDTAADVALKARAELSTHSDIVALFTVSGAGAAIILTAKAKAANDDTLNVAIDNDTCTGLTAAPTSANTTAGVAQDNAAAVGGKARTALELDADVSAYFDITGSGANIILTRKVEAADDGTLNIAIDNDTCAGLTAAPTSVNTRAGTAHDGANAIALAARTALAADSDVGGYFDVSGSGADIVLTCKSKAANDDTMNIALVDNTCTGITPAPTSTNTTGGVAQDDAAAVGGKVRTTLGNDADVSAYFDITGSGANIILTRKTEAADDGTMNIAIANDTCAGLTAAPTSANTRAGVAADIATGVGGKIRTALGNDADVNAFFTISGAGANVILTAKTVAPNDADMNISIGNGTALGLTPAPTSANTTGGAYDTVSAGRAKKFGLPQIVYNAAMLLVKLFDGSADSGSLAVDDDEVEKNLYSCAGTPNGSRVLDLYYLG